MNSIRISHSPLSSLLQLVQFNCVPGDDETLVVSGFLLRATATSYNTTMPTEREESPEEEDGDQSIVFSSLFRYPG